MGFTIAISDDRVPFQKNYWLWLFIIVFTGVWISTFTGTTDLNNWILENTLTVLFLTFLIVTFRRFQFSDLTYLLICIYLCLHVYGSKYTYAGLPHAGTFFKMAAVPKNGFMGTAH